jgi:hypothetical protein
VPSPPSSAPRLPHAIRAPLAQGARVSPRVVLARGPLACGPLACGLVCAFFFFGIGCDPPYPSPPKQCGGPGANGCLSDEVCVDFKCLPRPKCSADADCGKPSFQCVLPAQICELRPGFGDECREPEAPCGLGEFCALGLCRDRSTSRNCVTRGDCPVGQKCDHQNNLCIPDGPCTLAAELPELTCDFDETCDAFTGQCLTQCQNQCTPATELEDCGPTRRCDASCRCVQCLSNADCGAGLVCNARAGRCESENLCFTDEDCDSPLICDPATALCQVPPPPCEDDFDCAIAEVCDIATGRCFLPDGPCNDDRFEEADTPANARVLRLDPGDILLEDDLQICPNDDDYYGVVLEAGDALIVTVMNTLPQARATLFLLDSTAETSLDFAETPPRGSGRIVHAAQEAGIVFIRVTALVGATPYDLLLERATGTPCQPDFFEGQGGNDSILTATPPSLVPDGVRLSGTICPGDQDFFRLDVAAGEALSATVEFDGSATDLDVAFLKPSGDLIVQDAGTGAPAFVRQRFVSPGSVFVRVRGFGNASGSYTLTVRREPPFTCTPDAAEPDDLASVAPLPLGQPLAGEPRTMCAGDEDFLVVPVEDFERIIASARYDDSELELQIDVLDATGTELRASSPPATGGAAVAYDARGDETVVVRIRGKGGAIGAYTLRLDRENQLSCAPDAAEPNNTVASASPLPAPGQLLSLCESDQDFFRIEGAAGKKLIAEASFRQADGDIDLMLIGLDGAQILAVADGTADGERLEAVLPLDGAYTLRVFSLTSGARAPYTLNVTQVTP